MSTLTNELKLHRLQLKLKKAQDLLKEKDLRISLLRTAGHCCSNVCFNLGRREDSGLSRADRDTCLRACVGWDRAPGAR